MKILWLGVFDGKQWRAEYQVLQAFKRARVNIEPINMRSHALVEKLQHILIDGQESYDLILIQNGKHFNPQWLQAFSRPTVYWATEASARHARPFLMHEKPPAFVIANSVQTLQLARKMELPCERMHNGFDPTLYYYKRPTEKRYDVCMLGTMTGRRKHWYLETIKALGGRTIFCVMKHYSAATANNIYNASKIVLHIHAIGETYLPSRYFETLPTDGCLLVEKMGGNYDESLGRGHFVQFENRAEMIRLIRDLQQNERKRRGIVRKAHAEAPKHTWDERVKQMMKIFRRVAE